MMTVSTGLGSLPTLPAPNQCFNLHFQIHPVDSRVLLASCNSLWRLRQGGDWQAIFTPRTGSVVRSAVRTQDDLYLAGTSVGAVFAGVRGSAFERIAVNEFGGVSVTEIIINPADPAMLLIAFAGSNLGRILRATQNAIGAFDVEDVTGTLPAGLAVRTLAFDRLNERFLYAGTNRGVYRARVTTSSRWTWDQYGNGLPNPDIRALRVHPRTRCLACGDVGAGRMGGDHEARAMVQVQRQSAGVVGRVRLE